MPNVKNNLSDLIGNTPMLEVKTARLDWKIYLKLEYDVKTKYVLGLSREKNNGDLLP